MDECYLLMPEDTAPWVCTAQEVIDYCLNVTADGNVPMFSLTKYVYDPDTDTWGQP